MFKTQNFTIMWCEECHEKTVFEPGKQYEMKFNCKCGEANNEKADIRATAQTQRKGKRDKEAMGQPS